jgi:hypothetical protein
LYAVVIGTLTSTDCSIAPWRDPSFLGLGLELGSASGSSVIV